MKYRKSPLRGSVTQNVSARVQGQDGIGFLARLGFLAIFLLVLMLAATISWRYGWPQRQTLKLQKTFFDVTRDAQLEVKDIAVVGRRHSSKDNIYDALGVKQGMPILAVNLEESAARLDKLPWVKGVTVERRLPDTIYVRLFERIPMARWQKDDKFLVIDNQGRVLPTAKAEDFPQLPQVVGAGADSAAEELLSLLKGFPDIRDKMDAAVRVGERRWNLRLARKLDVRLPELDIETALNRLSVLISEEKILDRPLVAVDLRIPDRLVLEPTEEPKQIENKRP